MIELEEAKNFLYLSERSKQKLSDPEYQRLKKLVDKVWGQWQSWFLGQDRNAEHPFIGGLFLKRWKEPLETMIGLERREPNENQMP